MKRILVTGSSGFLGAHIASHLAQAGHQVVGVDTNEPIGQIKWSHITDNASDSNIMSKHARNMDVIIHVAAIPRPTEHTADHLLKVNLSCCNAAFEAAHRCNVKRVIYASSFSVFGYPFFERTITPQYLPIDDQHQIDAHDIYGVSKWLGEELLEAMVRRRPDISAMSLRMPWIQTGKTFYGEVGPRRISLDAARDLWAYIDVRDAADAFLSAVETPFAGHQRLLISAADTYSETPSQELISEAFPKSEIKSEFANFQSLIDYSAAHALLGFKPHHSWRDYERPDL